MKKFLIAILTPAIVAALSVTAFAQNANIDASRRQKIDVNARYVDSIDEPTVINADVVWDSMEFTYTVNGEKLWNPENHSFDINTSDTWSGNGNEITVINHSNTDLKVDFTFAAKNGYNTVTGSFSQNSFTLPTAEGKALDNAALAGKTALMLGGNLADTTTNFAVVGTVTVAISKA